MTTLDIEKMKTKINLIIQGIDPNTLLELDNKKIYLDNKELFDDIYSLLSAILKANGKIIKNDSRQKYPFFISEEEISDDLITKEFIPISTFVYRINEKYCKEGMKKLCATQITSWLQQEGFLEEYEHHDGKVFKIQTKKSKEIGMSSEHKINSYGREYDINLYGEKSQKFIIKNIQKITEREVNIKLKSF